MRLAVLALCAVAAACTGSAMPTPPHAPSVEADRVRWPSQFADGTPADSLLTPPGGTRCSGGLPDRVVLVGPPRHHAAIDTLDVRVSGLFCARDGRPARVLLQHGARTLSLPVNLYAPGSIQRCVDFLRARRPDGTLECLSYVREGNRFYTETELLRIDTDGPILALLHKGLDERRSAV